MDHSVARHLRIAVDSYDRSIREFIPGYDRMLDIAADVVAGTRGVTHVVDLGAGTGALSERILERMPHVVVELRDVDPEILRQARVRLAGHGARARFVEGSFLDSLPRADAFTASLALHHIRDADAKQAFYRRVAASLPAGGVLVSADVTMPDDPAAARRLYDAWAAHMTSSGITVERAHQYFAEWAGEDRYFSLETELELLRQAGLEPECQHADGPGSVIAAWKQRGAGKGERGAGNGERGTGRGTGGAQA